MQRASHSHPVRARRGSEDCAGPSRPKFAGAPKLRTTHQTATVPRGGVEGRREIKINPKRHTYFVVFFVVAFLVVVFATGFFAGFLTVMLRGRVLRRCVRGQLAKGPLVQGRICLHERTYSAFACCAVCTLLHPKRTYFSVPTHTPHITQQSSDLPRVIPHVSEREGWQEK